MKPEKPNGTKFRSMAARLRVRHVDGWWQPPEKGEHVISGVLVDSFPFVFPREKTASKALVLELTEPCANCVSSAEGRLMTAPASCRIAVPEWMLLEGLWPNKKGHKIKITRDEKRRFGRGRLLFGVRVKTSFSEAQGCIRAPTSVVLPGDAYRAALRADAEVRSYVKKPESMPQEVFDGVMRTRSHALKQIGVIDDLLMNWPTTGET